MTKILDESDVYFNPGLKQIIHFPIGMWLPEEVLKGNSKSEDKAVQLQKKHKLITK